MSSEHITYEGYTIAAETGRVEDSDRWSAILTITRGSGEDQESWIVSAGDVYDRRDTALTRCYAFARELIDREMKGCGLD